MTQSVEPPSNKLQNQGETTVVRGQKEIEILSYKFLERSNKNFLRALTDERIPKNTRDAVQLIRRMFEINPNFKFQLITNLQKSNINYYKLILQTGVEIRHIQGNKVNFAISKNEYVTVPISAMEKLIATGADIPEEMLWSTSQDLVSQAHQIFELMWKSAIPAELRIKEIEERVPSGETRVIRDPNEILSETKRMASYSRRYSVSSVPGGLLYAYNYAFDTFRNILERFRQEQHEGIRWVTTIDESCLGAARKFLELGMEIRDVSDLPTESFGISEKEVGVTVSRLVGGQLSSSALFSNDPMYIDHYSSVFQGLWERGVDARIKIKQIEDGLTEPTMRIIRNRSQTKKLMLDLINNAENEILVILPTSNAYIRIEKIGAMDALRSAVSLRGVKVGMLSPYPRITDTASKRLDEPQSQLINYKTVQEALGSNTVTILVFDRKSTLIIEQSDDSKSDFEEAIGVATYSTSASTVKANVRFFERVWEAEMLLEKETRSRKEAELLRDILAHDIRNYNQVSRMGTEFLIKHLEDRPDLEEIAHTVIEAIDGSTQLVDKAKKLGNILSSSERALCPVNLVDAIDRSLLITKSSNPSKVIKETRKIVFRDGSAPSEIDVLADELLDEIFVNLFSNAAKFTEGNNVSLDILIEEKQQEGTSLSDKVDSWQITIGDYGRGVSSSNPNSILNRYSEGHRGSGLGLSIVKTLVTLYGGQINIRNRSNGSTGTTGTIFEIWLKKP